jgi:hypothetical protein
VEGLGRSSWRGPEIFLAFISHVEDW